MSVVVGEDSIHKAAERCDLEAVRRFVEVEGVDVDCRDKDGVAPLIHAALIEGENARAASAVISYLVSKNANVEATLGHDDHPLFSAATTALMIAANYGNLPVVKTLLQKGHANVNRGKSGITALICATSSERGLCVVSTLLQHGAIVNQALPSHWHWSYIPLLRVCGFKGASMVVQQLLEHGANVDEKPDNGYNAMHIAAQCSDAATLRLLIAHGGNVNAQSTDTYVGMTPLSKAVYYGNVATLRVLLEHDVQVDVMLDCCDSILHVAARKDNAEIFRILLNHCRRTMAEAKFVSFLLHADEDGHIALQCTHSVKIAKLCIEQPRGRDQKLSPACHAQLTWCRASDRQTDSTVEYRRAFESLELSVSGDMRSEIQRTSANDEIAVKLNPKLNDFQLSVAEEALELAMDLTDCPDYMAHAILGYLSPVDVMKRRVESGVVWADSTAVVGN